MTGSIPPSGLDDTAARSGGAWLWARVSRAAVQTRRFAWRWSLGVGALTVVAAILPFVSPDPGAGTRVRGERLAADTLRAAQRVRTAEAGATTAESLLAIARSPSVTEISRPTVIPTAPTVPIGGDSTTLELARRIDLARQQRTPSAYLALASHPAVGLGPRMRTLAESLRALDARRGTANGATADTLAQASGRVGRTIVAIADNRLRELAALSVPSTTLPPAPSPPSAVASASAPDTLQLQRRLVAARDSLAHARRVRDSLTAALRALDTHMSTTPSRLTTFAPAVSLAVLLVVGLALAFGLALRRELERPTLADASEAERITGLRVLTTVREAPVEGPARFRPVGVDPFRMLYLGLTATGTRARTALVTGTDVEIVVTVGARLAIAAAADHRNTLVVDFDASQIALSRLFRERAEPGLSDVLAGAFSWRDVARPVGSGDGLAITMVPAGTERNEPPAGTDREAVLGEFARFRGAYELTLALAPADAVTFAEALVGPGPVVLCAVVGETTLESMRREVSALRQPGRKIHGLVLWQTARPSMPTRGELAALISKRKGRTPGGSFEAVQRVVQRDIKRTNEP